MPRGRVAYKQYSLYCIGLQAVLATAYYTVPSYTVYCYRIYSTAQAVPKTRAPAVRASKKDHHRSHGAPSYIEVMTLFRRFRGVRSE